MKFRSVTRVIVVLAATAALAQSPPHATTSGTPFLSRRPGLAGRGGPVGNKTPGQNGLPTLRQQVKDMESTLSQMHVVLKQMHAKAAKSTVKDSLAKTNLDMWELMVGHLDKQLQNLLAELTAREELEARRASLYRQADAKAEAEAQAARAAQAAKLAAGAPTPAEVGQGGEQNPAGQSAPGKLVSTPPASNSPSPTTAGRGSQSSAPPQ